MQTPTPTPMPQPTPGLPGAPQRTPLTPRQGCLLLAALPIVFLAVVIAAALFNEPQADGTVTITDGDTQTHLVAFGCINTIGEVAIPLRDEQSEEGFNIEERKLVLRDPRRDAIIPSGPVPTVEMSYIDADKTEHAIGECTRLESTLARGTVRFRILSQDSLSRRRSDWSGVLQADCSLPDGRDISIAMTLTDCR